jgi:hypothetical protein
MSAWGDLVDESVVGDRRQRTRATSRVGLALLGSVALVTGYIGFLQYRPPGPLSAASLADLLYDDLQLFALEFNSIGDGPVPWTLQAARVLAPLTTLILAAFALVGASWWWRRTMRWGFSIVVGDTAEARAVARAKRAMSRKAVFEISDGDMASLKRVGVKRARTVYACGADRVDVAANVATALAAASVSRTRGPKIYVHVTDPALALGLKARRLMTEERQRVEFFTMDEMAARAYVESEAFDATSRPDILVAGAGSFGRAVIVSFARHWRLTSGRGDERIRVTLVDEFATAVKAQVLERWKVVADSCDIEAIDHDLDTVLRSGRIGQPYRSYICYEDEHVALSAALAAVSLWHGGPGSLVVRLSQLARHGEAFEDNRLLDHLDGRLKVANVAELAAPFVARDPDLFVDLAQAVHTRYLAFHLRLGKRMGEEPALQPWHKLARHLQDSNYGQARDFANKLHQIGCTVAPRSALAAEFVLSESEVDKLAPLEHERYMAQRLADGWRHGPQRDDRRKVHPDLVPWERLAESSRAKDREAVRNLQTTYETALADIGLQIVRLGG